MGLAQMWSCNACLKRTRRCLSVSADRSSDPVATWTYRHVDLEESPHPDGFLIKRPVVALMRAPGTAQLRGVIDSGRARLRRRQTAIIGPGGLQLSAQSGCNCRPSR